MTTSIYGPSVVDAITLLDYDLHNHAFSQTTNIQDEYVLESLHLTFSTAEAKDIRLVSTEGRTVWSALAVTSQSLTIVFNEAFDFGDQLTLTITATTALDLVNGYLRVRPGAVLPVEYSIKQRLEDILRKFNEGFAITEKASLTTYGSLATLAPGATGTVVQLVANNYNFRGFSATGNGDGYFTLEVNSVTVLAGRIHALEKTVDMSTLGPLPVTDGITIRIRVRIDTDVTCSYEGTLIGENAA